MAQTQHRIVIKKVRRQSQGHGGQWKIAYADFVTAMMAFFLLMWLLGYVAARFRDPGSIARYFRLLYETAGIGTEKRFRER
ncbi:chemotaxis protein MotB [Nitrosospira multiformis]|uniref:Chemotaxis protein MotB n=1 Tax=Nitrosospira multiformis TaxID=1231 RepID=A0A1H8BC59_9PROT|nr:chemotaxis protein MotB [Nitrosospira multiformis]